MIPEVGDLAHPSKPHMRSPGNQAGANRTIVGFLFCVAAEHVTKSFHEPTVSGGAMEHTAHVHLGERLEKGMVDGLTVARILQGPADLGAASFDLKMVIFPRSDTPIDLNKTVFKALFKLG